MCDAAAYHVAGHAVVALATGRELLHLDVDGGCVFEPFPEYGWRSYFHTTREIMIAAGGEVAERMRMGRVDAAATRLDRQRARLVASGLVREHLRIHDPVIVVWYLRYCRRRAEWLLRSRWGAVRRIAGVLGADGVISGNAALLLFRRCQSEAPGHFRARSEAEKVI
jgi:hypothetical protein